MKAKALEQYSVPAYPTQQEVLQNSRLIQRPLSSPVRHLLETGISGAMALLVPLSGCDRNPAGPAGAPSSQQADGQDPNATKTTAKPKTNRKALLVAPIFEHGEGRGATGCIVSAPPAFLSEEEGLSIIKEELSKKGVQLENKKIVFKKIQTHKAPWDHSTEPGFLETDLADGDERIILEFISQDDYYDLGGERSGSTAQSFDFKKVAQQLCVDLKTKAGRGVFGVFYDPLVKINFSRLSRQTPLGQPRPTWNQMRVEAKTEATELLRQQAQDFAQWLADNKVI
jgi:hypothetical protein